mmetsp:Transcript_5330/g.8218  ORF Transcript_5330/g.8218 Transcript_5330/m.8218 type:complete len:192 (+) Transcript_5330:404-979(+)
MLVVLLLLLLVSVCYVVSFNRLHGLLLLWEHSQQVRLLVTLVHDHVAEVIWWLLACCLLSVELLTSERRLRFHQPIRESTFSLSNRLDILCLQSLCLVSHLRLRVMNFRRMLHYCDGSVLGSRLGLLSNQSLLVRRKRWEHLIRVDFRKSWLASLWYCWRDTQTGRWRQLLVAACSSKPSWSVSHLLIEWL